MTFFFETLLGGLLAGTMYSLVAIGLSHGPVLAWLRAKSLLIERLSALVLLGIACWKQNLDAPGLFASGNQVAIQFIEVLWFLAQRGGKTVTSSHLLLHLVDQLAHVGVVEAL